jgi:hypothetical protein
MFRFGYIFLRLLLWFAVFFVPIIPVVSRATYSSFLHPWETIHSVSDDGNFGELVLCVAPAALLSFSSCVELAMKALGASSAPWIGIGQIISVAIMLFGVGSFFTIRAPLESSSFHYLVSIWIFALIITLGIEMWVANKTITEKKAWVS